MRHYNGAPRAVLRPLIKRKEDRYVIKEFTYVRRRFSRKLEPAEVYISMPAEFFDCERFDSVCVYGDDITTLITMGVIGVSTKYDILIGKLEFQNGVACFNAQLHPTAPEDIQDVLVLTSEDILSRNYGLGMVGMSIGKSSIFAVNVPIDLLVDGYTGMLKMSKARLFDELKKQTAIFLKEHNAVLEESNV